MDGFGQRNSPIDPQKCFERYHSRRSPPRRHEHAGGRWLAAGAAGYYHGRGSFECDHGQGGGESGERAGGSWGITGVEIPNPNKIPNLKIQIMLHSQFETIAHRMENPFGDLELGIFLGFGILDFGGTRSSIPERTFK